jgi:hypothetical protein
MKPKTIDQLRKDSPGKFVFVFCLGSPETKFEEGDTYVYQGILPVSDNEALLAFEKRLRKLLLDTGGTVALPKRKPPAGMVSIQKKRTVGEEGE